MRDLVADIIWNQTILFLLTIVI